MVAESYTFTYGNSQWKDQLTQVSFTNMSGTTATEELEYDAIGNPTKYFNRKTVWEFDWHHGRQLQTAEYIVNGAVQRTIENTYDVDGIRETKTVDGVTHTYTTLDGKIVRETYSGKTIDYLYDNEGRPYKLMVNTGTSTYTGVFLLNLQGDVIGIIDEDGAEAVTYEYDAWGKESGHSLSGNYGSILYAQKGFIKN